MTRSEAVAAIQRRLRMHTLHEAEIQSELQLHQSQLERMGVAHPGTGGVFWPWFLRKYVEFTTNTKITDLPLELLQLHPSDPLLVYFEDKWVELPRRDMAELYSKYPATTDPGPPQAWCSFGTRIELFPAPDTLYTLRLFATYADVTLANDIENAWLRHASGILIGETGASFAQALVSTAQTVNYFMTLSASSRMAVYNAGVVRATAGRKFALGGNAI